jgi:hypothetical protein
MKIFSMCLLLACCFVGSGCMSIATLEQTKLHTRYNRKTKEREPVEGQPVFYALLPLTVPADIATAPLQVIAFFILAYNGQIAITGH